MAKMATFAALFACLLMLVGCEEAGETDLETDEYGADGIYQPAEGETEQLEGDLGGEILEEGGDVADQPDNGRPGNE